MKLLVKKGKTSKRVLIFIQDSSSSTGAGLPGLTNSSSGLTCYRVREDDGNTGAVQLPLVAGTRGTWSSGGFVEKDPTNTPGFYELGLDNAGLVAGSDTVLYMLKGATNMAPLPIEIQLVDFDPQNAQLGLPVDANNLLKVDVEDWKGASAPANTGDAFARLGAPAGASVSVDIAAVKAAIPTIQAIVTAIFQDLMSSADFGTAGSFGALVKANLDTNVGSRLASSSYIPPPTPAQISNVILTDTMSADLSAPGSLGYIVGHAPGWYTSPPTPPTPAQIAMQVWQDLLASADFGTANSVGALVKAVLSAIPAFPTNFSNSKIDTNGRYAIQSGVTKDVAFPNFAFLMTDPSGNELPNLTLANITAQRLLDNGTWTACDNAPRANIGNGVYLIDLTANDRNGSVVSYKFSATGAEDTIVNLNTTP